MWNELYRFHISYTLLVYREQNAIRQWCEWSMTTPFIDLLHKQLYHLSHIKNQDIYDIGA